jgi:hypothetical protein
MRCAEHHDNEHEWLRRYDLQGVYKTVYDILTDNYELFIEEPEVKGD